MFIFLSGDQVEQLDKAFTPHSAVLGSRGWRVVVHEKNTLPEVTDRGYDIIAGLSTSFRLKQSHVSRLPSPYTNCVKHELVPKTKYLKTPSVCKKTVHD